MAPFLSHLPNLPGSPCQVLQGATGRMAPAYGRFQTSLGHMVRCRSSQLPTMGNPNFFYTDIWMYRKLLCIYISNSHLLFGQNTGTKSLTGKIILRILVFQQNKTNKKETEGNFEKILTFFNFHVQNSWRALPRSTYLCR